MDSKGTGTVQYGTVQVPYSTRVCMSIMYEAGQFLVQAHHEKNARKGGAVLFQQLQYQCKKVCLTSIP